MDGEASGRSRTGDILFDAFYSAGIGGAVVAVFFLVADVVMHEAFWTPTVVGTVLFTDTAAADVSAVQLEIVALFTVLHFLSFGVLGLIMSVFVHSWAHMADRPALVAVVGFLLLHTGFTGLDLTLAPGILEALGYWKVLSANAVTGAGMAYFLLRSHRQAMHGEDLMSAET